MTTRSGPGQTANDACTSSPSLGPGVKGRSGKPSADRCGRVGGLQESSASAAPAAHCRPNQPHAFWSPLSSTWSHGLENHLITNKGTAATPSAAIADEGPSGDPLLHKAPYLSPPFQRLRRCHLLERCWWRPSTRGASRPLPHAHSPAILGRSPSPPPSPGTSPEPSYPSPRAKFVRGSERLF